MSLFHFSPDPMGLKGSAIIGNNTKLLATLNTFLKPVVHSGHHWQLCWRGTRDGFESSQFHTLCDGKAPTVTIIKNKQYIFGGVTSLPWWSKFSFLIDFLLYLYFYLEDPTE